MTVEQTTPVQSLIEPRLAVYRFLLRGLDKPGPEQHLWMLSPAFAEGLRQLAQVFDLACPVGELVPSAFVDHESRFLACFEVGVPESPVVLQASHYKRREPVPATIHEHILFYKRFGARITNGNIEPADHCCNELAFLVHLDELLLEGRVDRESILRARRDFLARQVTRWAPAAAASAEEKGLPTLYQFLLTLLARAVEQDLTLTQEALEHPQGDEPT